MELTKQVPNLELCKRMVELGWSVETLYYWTNQFSLDERWQTPERNRELKKELTKKFRICEQSFLYPQDKGFLSIPAPTVSELGEAISRDGFIDYLTHNELTTTLAYKLLTDPNACAKMWIYLKENKLI